MGERDEMDACCMSEGLELIARYDAKISTLLDATQLRLRLVEGLKKHVHL